MPILRKHSFLKKIKDISIAGSISLAIMAGGATFQSCSNSQEYETVYTKGIHTYIEELEPGNFKVVEEKVSEDGSSAAFVSYLDGRTEMINEDQIKALIAEKETTIGAESLDAESLNWQTKNDGSADTTSTTKSYHRPHMGLGTLLFYSSMGSMFGRSGVASPNPGVYANQTAYQNSQQTRTQYKNSAVSRPVSSSRGYFNSSSSGRSFGS